MLLPGRFTSDTNSRSLLVSRSTWTTTMVDTCYPVVSLVGTASVLGIASFSSSGGTFAAAAPRATDGIILNQSVTSGIDNVLTFDVAKLEESDEEGVLVTVLETIDNVPYVIGGGRLRQGKDQRISFRSTGNNIQVVLNGPYSAFILNQVCTRYARSTAQTYLVEVRDESKDRYRFGFNGKEKDNELKGVGNSLDFGARIYDSRIGKFLSLDPLSAKYPSVTPYEYSQNTPISMIDKGGRNGEIVITKKSKEKGAAIEKIDVNVVLLTTYKSGESSYRYGHGNDILYAGKFEFANTYGRKTFEGSVGNQNYKASFNLSIRAGLAQEELNTKLNANSSYNKLTINQLTDDGISKQIRVLGNEMNFNTQQTPSWHGNDFSHEISHLLGGAGDYFGGDNYYMSSYSRGRDVQDNEVNEILAPAIRLAEEFEGTTIKVHLITDTNARGKGRTSKEEKKYNTYKVYDDKTGGYLKSVSVPQINPRPE